VVLTSPTPCSAVPRRPGQLSAILHHPAAALVQSRPRGARYPGPERLGRERKVVAAPELNSNFEIYKTPPAIQLGISNPARIQVENVH